MFKKKKKKKVGKIMWSINCPKRSLQPSDCVCYFVINVLISSGYIHESRITEMKLESNIPLIIVSAVGQDGSLSS